MAVLENAVSYKCKLPDKSPSKNEQAQQKSIPLTLSFLAGVGSRSEVVSFLVFDIAHVPLLARDDGDCTSVGAAIRKDDTAGPTEVTAQPSVSNSLSRHEEFVQGRCAQVLLTSYYTDLQ